MLRKELGRRMREPIGRVVFVGYFIFVVLILGGMGWIIPFHRFALGDSRAVSEVPSALSTYFLALLAGALANIVLDDETTAENLISPSTTKGFRMLSLGLSLLGFLLAFVGIQNTSTHIKVAYVASITGIVLSLFLWWVLNADSTRWRDEMPEPTSAVGGPTAVELKGETGGLIV